MYNQTGDDNAAICQTQTRIVLSIALCRCYTIKDERRQWHRAYIHKPAAQMSHCNFRLKLNTAQWETVSTQTHSADVCGLWVFGFCVIRRQNEIHFILLGVSISCLSVRYANVCMQMFVWSKFAHNNFNASIASLWNRTEWSACYAIAIACGTQ